MQEKGGGGEKHQSLQGNFLMASGLSKSSIHDSFI